MDKGERVTNAWDKRDRKAQSDLMKRLWAEGKVKLPTRLCGSEHPGWKGDNATPFAKRLRAQKAFPLGPCEECGVIATDRHHKDGNTGNNQRSNIAILCRRCHMTIDGRLARLIAARPDLTRPPKPCVNCERLSKPLRRGRCHACNEYFRRHGHERRPRFGEKVAV